MKRVSGIHSLLTITIWLVSLSVLPRSTFTFSLTSVLRCFRRSISKMSTWHGRHRFGSITLSIHVSCCIITKVCPLRPFCPRSPNTNICNLKEFKKVYKLINIMEFRDEEYIAITIDTYHVGPISHLPYKSRSLLNPFCRGTRRLDLIVGKKKFRNIGKQSTK